MTEKISPGFEMVINGAEVGVAQRAYHPVKVMTNRGSIFFRHYKVPGSHLGAILLNGAGGGWSSPAKEVYPRLCRGLMNMGINSIQLSYRQPNSLEECVLDALAAVAFFQHEGVSKMALIGHSFGAAVAIQAAAVTNEARAVIGIAAQSYGAAPVSLLDQSCSTLLLHGENDRVLPQSCSEYIYNLAHEPKQLIIYEKAGHSLDEVAAEVYRTIFDWVMKSFMTSGTITHH
jgi:pimeloyl-ACP methyl ester carboxylesterase